jgi:hypothetical protein
VRSLVQPLTKAVAQEHENVVKEDASPAFGLGELLHFCLGLRACLPFQCVLRILARMRRDLIDVFRF